ncbi:MAG TPA: hypothetical protein VM163_06960 [bacterium]|nr:hypothetical protein [bacterium]
MLRATIYMDSKVELKRIRNQASAENVRVTLHAHQEMVEEGDNT